MKMRGGHPEPVLGDAYIAAIARALRPGPLGKSTREALRQRILERVAQPPPPDTRTVRGAEADWVELGPGLRMKVLHRDLGRGEQTALFEMSPGAEFPPHAHGIQEEVFVVQGECFIGRYRLSRGDMHVSAAGSKHGRTTSPRGALLLVRSEILGSPPAAA